MKISLIVPAYNEERYIGRLLDSLTLQSCPPDEIIVCDNNSTDNTVKIVKKFQESLPIKVIFEPKKGIQYAVETAWKNTTGDLIIRADADCLLPVDWVKKYKDHFEKDPSLQACGGGSRAADGSFVYHLLTPIAAEVNRFILLLVKGHLILFGANFAIKRDTLEMIDGYKSSLPTSQDDFLICQKLSKSKQKYRYFFDTWNYTSTRRFANAKEVILVILSIFTSKFYLEKSI